MPTKRIPTIIGLLLILGSLGLLSFAFNKTTQQSSVARTLPNPSNVAFSNITDTSFTVTWFTDEPSTGFISVTGPDNNNFIAYDDRDQAGTQTGNTVNIGEYTTHIVTMRNVTAATTYQVSIENSQPTTNATHIYEVTTGPTLPNPSTLEPSYGNAINPDGSPAVGALVFVTLENSQIVSSYVSQAGTWVIPLNFIRSQDLQAYISNADRIEETIIVQTHQGQSKAITDTKNDNPVPTMVIGKEYDYRKIQAALLPTTIPSPKLGNYVVGISAPKNNAALPTDLPLFSGTGVPGTPIAITVGINKPTSDTVTVGSDGLWRFTPKTRLAAGRQSITITTKDQKGKTIALTNLFEILKSGTQVLGDATPSGTLAPTQPTQITTPTPTVILTQPIPQTGISFPLLIAISIGFLLFATGLSLFTL